MANLTLRGSARSKGFDPLNVPDETNKLLRAVLNKPTPTPTVNLDSIEIGTVAGLSAFPIQ